MLGLYPLFLGELFKNQFQFRLFRTNIYFSYAFSSSFLAWLYANRVEVAISSAAAIFHLIPLHFVAFRHFWRYFVLISAFWLSAKWFLQFIYLLMQLRSGLLARLSYLFSLSHFFSHFLHLIVLIFALAKRGNFFFYPHYVEEFFLCVFLLPPTSVSCATRDQN